MDPLSATASVIAILQLSAKVLAYLNDVKDAPKGQAQCAIEASNIHNLLTNLRFRLEEGHAHQPWFNAVQALAVKNGPLDQFKQALESLQAKMTDGGRLKNALIWKFKKEEVDAILARMERLKTLIKIALHMDHFKISQAIKDDTDSIRTHVSAIQSAVDKVRHGQVTRRQEGTGQYEAKTTLFYPGIPGAGKTIVAAIAIDHLLDSAQNSAYGVAYIYCNYKSQADQDTASILAAILKQLGQGRPSALGPVERLHHKHASRGTRPSLDDAFSALRDVVAQYPYVFIVVDALDECQRETRRQLLSKLLALQKEADIRLTATSRFVPDVEDALRPAIRLEVKASNEDVKQFMVGQICRLPRCVQRNKALQDLVQERVVEAVDGMFLLTRLHIDSLSDKTTAKEVKLTLATLSKGTAALNNAYYEALERIEGQQAVKSDEAELDPENKPDVEDLVSVCAGLVVVDQESAVIRLVHYTTQEYFKRASSYFNPAAQLLIAKTYLTYLSFSVFKSGSYTADEDFEERLRQHKLLDYAARHYGEHVRCVEAKVAERVRSFLTHDSLLACAVQVLYIESSYRYKGYRKSDVTFTGLHWAARFGLCEVARRYLRTKGDDTVHAVNARDSSGGHSLMYAVEHGHYEMAKLLLDKGADVNAQGGEYGNALYAASWRGHEAVVKLLLDTGADVNAQGGEYGNALQAASYGGHEAVVKLLLDTGADVNAQGGDFDNALQAASEGGHEAVVKLLLDTGADVNAQGGEYGNALQVASWRGHEAVVKLLLDTGADVNAQGGYFGNALHAALYRGHEAVGGVYDNALQAASEGGHEAVVKPLLDNDANIYAAGNEYNS
ncbi:ankyrin repeat domain-containing protein [Phaeosphaeriaceae sp. PMI808]|nr:ankyrin repeat domain-containing protein [Phaeosphaeriaceae sp. PMI808]